MIFLNYLGWFVVFRRNKGHFCDNPVVGFSSNNNFELGSWLMRARFHVSHTDILLETWTESAAGNLSKALTTGIMDLTVAPWRWACREKTDTSNGWTLFELFANHMGTQESTLFSSSLPDCPCKPSLNGCYVLFHVITI